MDLFVFGECKVGVKAAVAVMTEHHNTRLLGARIKHVQVRRMPPTVDRDTQVEVRQHTVVRVVDCLYITAVSCYDMCDSMQTEIQYTSICSNDYKSSSSAMAEGQRKA